jgi:hypothetical protein
MKFLKGVDYSQYNIYIYIYILLNKLTVLRDTVKCTRIKYSMAFSVVMPLTFVENTTFRRNTSTFVARFYWFLARLNRQTPQQENYMFFRNVALSPNCTAFQSRRRYTFLFAVVSISNPSNKLTFRKNRNSTRDIG